MFACDGPHTTNPQPQRASLQAAGSLGGKHAWKAAPCASNCYPDGAVADEAIRQLRAHANNNERFFLAVGFKRPHLGWMAPTQFFDLYNTSDIAIAKCVQRPTHHTSLERTTPH